MRFASRAVAVAAVMLLLASCSSEAPAPDGPATSTSPSAHGAYAACLAANGVSTPPVGPGAPPGVDPQTWAKAAQACADEAPGPAAP